VGFSITLQNCSVNLFRAAKAFTHKYLAI